MLRAAFADWTSHPHLFFGKSGRPKSYILLGAFSGFSGLTFPWEDKRKMRELRKPCGEALMLCELCPKSRGNFWLGVKGWGMKGTKGEGKLMDIQAEVKGNVGYGFALVGVDGQIVLSAPSQSHYTWARGLLWLPSCSMVGAQMRCEHSHGTCNAALCCACQHLPWTRPSGVWHIPALPKHSQEVLRTQALCSSSWEELDLQLFRFMLVRAIFKKKTWHFSVIFFGSIKRPAFS